MTEPTEPTPTPLEERSMACTSCGRMSTQVRSSPMNRDLPVCRECFNVQRAVRKHALPDEAVVAATGTFIAEHDTPESAPTP